MKCRIANITELDGITPKASHAHRVRRTGELLSIRIGYPMWLAYSDDHGTLMTSTIEEINEGPSEFRVKTRSSIYVLDKV